VENELEIKTGRIQEMLESEKLAGVLLNSQHNFAWLTGGRSNGIDLSRDNGAATILVGADGKRFLIASSIEIERFITEEVSAADFEPVSIPWQEEKASAHSIVSAAERLLPSGGRIGSDLSLSAKCSIAEPAISECRYHLTSAEMDKMRSLGRDAGNAAGRVVRSVYPGMTELDVARSIRNELAAESIHPVVTLVGADERIKLYRHPLPTENLFRRHLLIAACARRHGLIVSLTRIVCVGAVPDELARRTEAAARVNAALHSATVPGARAADLYNVAERAYAEAGFPEEIHKHHQGGACGYRTRDWVAHPANQQAAVLHQAFAWNPSITGTKTEETGIITENGFEVITATEDFPQIVTNFNGREFCSPGIFSLSKGAAA
jgi:Xaa-Pro dipeptidase